MAERQVIKSLLAAGWESVSIRLVCGEYSISVAMDDWWTDNPYAARPLPTGKGETLDEAYAALVADVRGA